MMKKRVLIVDDDVDTLLLIKTIAELEGYDARTAQNGAEALRLIEGHYRPDLILLDLMMPVMDGWTFSRRVRQREETRNTPIVVLSGINDIRRRTEGLPVNACVTKPVEYDDIRGWFGRFLGDH